MGSAVIVAANSVLGRAGIAHVLAAAGFEVIATCGTAEDLVQLAARQQPDVVVVEGRLPPARTDEHIRAVMEIRRASPGIGVLILGRRVDVALGGRLIAAGAERLGWLLKDRLTDVAQFTDAVRAVADGHSALDPVLISMLLSREHAAGGLGALTPREHQVLALMARGRSNQAIAAELVVTQRAVEKHVANVFDKLRLPDSPDDHRRVLAVLRYLSP